MILSNVDKIYREYPFLEKILPRVSTATAQVNRWGEKFFKTSPVEWYDDRYTYKFLLLDQGGNIVGRVGESWNPFWTRNENAGQALARLKDKAESVRYAVSLRDGNLILYRR